MRTHFLNSPEGDDFSLLLPLSLFLRLQHVRMILLPLTYQTWKRVNNICDSRSKQEIEGMNEVSQFSQSRMSSRCCVCSDTIRLFRGRMSAMSGVPAVASIKLPRFEIKRPPVSQKGRSSLSAQYPPQNMMLDKLSTAALCISGAPFVCYFFIWILFFATWSHSKRSPTWSWIKRAWAGPGC